MAISRLVFNARRTRLFMFFFIVVSFVFLISTNYSVYVRTKAYEIYIKIDKSSIKGKQQKSNENMVARINEFFKGTASLDSTVANSDENLFSIINSTYKYESGGDLCSIIPPHLSNSGFKISDLRPKVNTTVLEFGVIEKLFRNLLLNHGGLWSPKACKARHRVAVVVPYRDREANLKLFLHHMHPFLMRQQADYGVFIVEPVEKIKFNRGMLMNIGYVEASKMYRNTENKTHWQCFAFHDADLLPEDERNLYSCPEQPRHMSSAVSTFNYKLPYETLFGGVTMFSNAQYDKVNGFSNLYFGWGGEDDDLANRVVHCKYKIARYPLEIGRYLMATHEKDKPNADRHKYLTNSHQRMDKDGLNSLKYEVVKVEKTLLYTKLYVYYNETEIMSREY